jgi:hypothetical protein
MANALDKDPAIKSLVEWWIANRNGALGIGYGNLKMEFRVLSKNEQLFMV